MVVLHTFGVVLYIGVKDTYNVTVDFMGLQNEGAITGGSPAFAVALRKSLDAAGFQSVLIDCCDSHDFGTYALVESYLYVDRHVYR